MDMQGQARPSGALLEGRFAGRDEFSGLIRDAFATAAVQGWREILICDTDFADWPLGDRVVTQALNAWSQRGRKFTMVAKSYDEVIRRHARFATWRRTWTHLVECRQTASSAVDELPSALIGPSWSLERQDLQPSGGMAGCDATQRATLRERVNVQLKKSVAGYALTTLGL